MSATLSVVRKNARRGPISSAHERTASAIVPLPRSNAVQRRRPDSPVPRWSKTTRSREASAGARISAKSRAAGSAACPGPPASATTAARVGLSALTTRLMLSDDGPGADADRVERDVEAAALEAGGRARGVGDRRVGRGRGGGRRGDHGGEEREGGEEARAARRMRPGRP